MQASDEALPELGERQRSVLLAVIEEHVATAEPVASASVARKRSVGVSAATARSVMASLTELGLLHQPHTSAGREPTELAFRLYADQVVHEALAREPGETAPLALELEGSAGQVESLVQRTVEVLSDATGQLAFVLGPRPDELVLEQVRLVRLSSERVMAVLISERGVVLSRVFEEPESDARELELAARRLSELVGGASLPTARKRLAAALEEARQMSDRLWSKALALGLVTLDRRGEDTLIVGDKAHLLAQPEFADVERLRDLLAAVEEKDRMVRLLDRILSADVLGVRVGAEIEDPDIRECALVTAPLGESPTLGGLGVLGPVRMRYDRVVPLVRSLSLLVGRYLS